MPYIPLIARVEALPPLPESVLEIEKLFAMGDPDVDKLVKIIESDPLLTTDILAKANAPYYGFSHKIISILQAVTLFGSTQIRSLVLSASLQRDFDVDLTPYGIATSTFSKISTVQSELIFQWYVGIDITIARALTPIAFLMETGKILIAKDIIDNGKRDIFLHDLKEYEDISYVENLHTMMTTAQINALIFEHLNLNESFYETMHYLDNDREVPKELREMVLALRVVRTAINIQEQLTENSLEMATQILQEEQIDPEIFLRSAQRIQKKYIND
jgi:HD-like signal output (HDOD) protein